MGMNEGIVPKSLSTGGILSDMERELLISHDIDLAPTKRQQAFTEQFYIYLSMTKPKDKLYLTYHKVNGEGKSTNPSFLIGKLMQLFPKTVIINEDGRTDDVDYILGDHGLAFLAEGLREFQQKPTTDLWKELFLYYKLKMKPTRFK